MSSVVRVSVLAALVFAAPAEARTLTIDPDDGPQMTLTVPAGWLAREPAGRGALELRRPGRRLVLYQCLVQRPIRDITGRSLIGRDAPRIAPGVYGSPNVAAVLVRGGSCLIVTGRGAAAVAARLDPELGPGGPPPRSDAAAERLAREARRRTLAMERVTGLALAIPHHFDARIEAEFEWDLPARYRHQVTRYGSVVAEVVRDRVGDHLREERPCWGGTSPAEIDDTLEPRLELQERQAPPATATSWRVAYAPAEPQPDGSTLVRWTGFAADGEAVIAPDGRLRRVRIEDHDQLIGRSDWRTVEIVFTGFPVAVAPVRTEPDC